MDSPPQQAIPNILIRLAHLLGTEIKDRKLEIPAKFGKGYCEGYIFNEHIRMFISNYELKEDVLLENPDVNIPGRLIVFKFQNIFPPSRSLHPNGQPNATPSVLVATSRINTDTLIPIHTNTATITIEIEAGYLNTLFRFTEKSAVLGSLLDNTQPLLFEQLVYPSLQQVVDEILTQPVEKTFRPFLLRVKAEELICKLLMELDKRDEKHLYALNAGDIQALYTIKEQMLARLDTPPLIQELADSANMSPSKLKRLFRQIFGDSIFSYYQHFRMKEAARLLKEEKLSVSETGYQLGFTNLSHFSRVFEAHHVMKPKKYSRS